MQFHLCNFLRFIKGSAHIQKYQCNGSSNFQSLICSSTQSQKFLHFFTRTFWELRSAMFASLEFLNVLLWLDPMLFITTDGDLLARIADFFTDNLKSSQICVRVVMWNCWSLGHSGSWSTDWPDEISRSQRGVLSWTYLLYKIWSVDFKISYVNEICNVFLFT